MQTTLPCPALAYIPQRRPFVLVDELVEVNETRAVAAFTVPAGHILAEGGALSAEGLVENMAQTAAAGSGWRGAVGKLESEGRARMGFIGAVKHLVIHGLPQAGERIVTTVEARHQVGNATIVHCEVRGADGGALAECELTIFLQE